MNSSKENPTLLDLSIPLDFNTALKLPDSHTWTTTPLAVQESVADIVHVIDLASPNALDLIRQASEKWGMFQVTNHGIPVHLFHQIEDQARSLFSLPGAQKLLAARSRNELTGYGQAAISPFFSKEMWYEGFTIVGSPAEHASKLWPNQPNVFWYVRLLAC